METVETAVTRSSKTATPPLANRLVLAFSRHWLLFVNLFNGLFIGGAVLTSLLMALGLTGPAQVLYRFYGLNCHQLPQRSYYLFGANGPIQTYSLEQVLGWGGDPANLRAFIGNAEIGYKVAIAHRLTALHSGLFVFGLLFALVRRWLKPLPWKGFLLLIVPMIVDGLTHVLTDLVAGITWRATNAWAVALTGGLLGPDFYQGTAMGTLNWLLRTVTGALFALACIWLAYPFLERGLRRPAATGGQARRRGGLKEPHYFGENRDASKQ
jgi:uncharacterized membrane protein